MAFMFGQPRKGREDELRDDPRLMQAKEAYTGGKIKIVTTEAVPNRDTMAAFGLIASRGYSLENSFYGLIAQALDVNADAIVGYREAVAFHPEGDKHYSCYGTAVRLKPMK